MPERKCPDCRGRDLKFLKKYDPILDISGKTYMSKSLFQCRVCGWHWIFNQDRNIWYKIRDDTAKKY